MGNRQTIRVLCADADREKLREIREALGSQGVKTVWTDGAARGNDVVLAVLSEAFYADKAAVDALLGMVGAGTDDLLPLQLDGAPIPETIKRVLYSRNIIPTAGRSAAHTAERIISAVPRKKSRLPLILSAGALALAVITGLLIWRSTRNKAVPAMAETQIPIPAVFGLTGEDLAKIEDVVIVGDKVAFLTGAELDAAMEEVRSAAGAEGAPFVYFDVDRHAVLDENARDGRIHWYGMETGQELGAVRYEDLRFLGLMPNLRYLSLALVDVPEEGLPDLRGAEKLTGVALLSCGIEQLDWISGAPVQELMIRFTPIRDFGPLTACGKLRQAHVDMRESGVEADFSAFAPPGLENLSLWHADFSEMPDLAFLSSLTALRRVQLLEPSGARTLAGVEGLDLKEFEIVNGFDLRDISALSSLKSLTSLTIDDCPSVGDFRPIGGCAALESVMLYPGMDARLRSADFLGGLPELREIRLYSVDLPDLDFLRPLGQSRPSLETFDFSGDVRDFSALSAVGHYDMLGIDLYGGSLDRVNADLSGTSVSYLYLRRIGDLNLGSLPRVEERLFLNECGLRDLSTLPEGWATRRVQLYGCDELRSLEGLQRLGGFREDGKGVLEVYYCPRLADWSALNGKHLEKVILNGVYALPDFARFHTERLRLENAVDVTDLDFLRDMDASAPCSFEILLDGVQSLAPLGRFHGDSLTVPPTLADQAEDLVKNGNFREYSVEYPGGGWEIDTSELVLESLEDLETLPGALLRRVRAVCAAGDRIVEPGRYEVFRDGELFFRDRETGEQMPLGPGAIADVGIFSELSGLRELTLLEQPLTDLNGIQSLGTLESFRAEYCGELRDVSALFALQSLTEVSLRGTAADSLQGVQNLDGLRRLDLAHTNVTDLSPLPGLPSLESVTVSADMVRAIDSLNGQDIRFTLDVID